MNRNDYMGIFFKEMTYFISFIIIELLQYGIKSNI